MSDLTRGPVWRHILGMAAFLATGLAFQSAYFIVDLYFVSRLGKAAVAGVGSAGNFFYLALAAAQLLGVGCIALISQAIGRRDAARTSLVFNQTLLLSVIFAGVTLVAGYAAAAPVCQWLGADQATADAARRFLYGQIPALAIMFPNTVLSASLRAAGIVRPTMLLQTASVLINIALAPVLITGWPAGWALGPFGAGLASTTASLFTLIFLGGILPRIQTQLAFRPGEWAPRLEAWGALMKVGLPAAGEFMLIFLINLVVYAALRRFGPAAQAGYGIGGRIMQSLFLPTLAISFATGPVAGQNFGAGKPARVIETFRVALLFACLIMAALTALCQVSPTLLARPFTKDPAVLAIAASYFRIVSWNFPTVGIVFACNGMFQGLADTLPSFLSASSRLVTFVLPCIALAAWQGARIEAYWYVAVAANLLQATISLLLLRRTFAHRLAPLRAQLQTAQE